MTFPERGTRRDDLRSGLRTTTYRRRVTIAFHIATTQVVVDRILYSGRYLAALFNESNAGPRVKRPGACSGPPSTTLRVANNKVVDGRPEPAPGAGPGGRP